jgi:hypothetical protein
MAISKKPSSKGTASEAQIQAIIEKGGSVADVQQDAGKKNLQLRLEADLIGQIDSARKTKAVPPSRHTWILEAIFEKLQKENQGF